MEIRSVSVLGAGTMGAGIAQVCAQAGCDVRLFDVTAELAAKGMKRITEFLAKGVEKGKIAAPERDAALARLRTVLEVRAAVSGADLVVEAVPEDLELKRKLFREVAEAAAKGAILATNTSSLPITRIAEGNAAAPRIVGMHLFNPVPLRKLLELVVGEKTADATVASARAFGVRLGKEVITVRDRPGFASSRLGIAIAMEAIRMVEEGVASPDDIDKAMVHGYGHPMGPLRLTDVVGCDIRLAIADHLAEALKAPHFKPPQLLRKMVAEGRLGKKSGRGFYEWKD